MTESSPVTELCPNPTTQSGNNANEAAVRKTDNFDMPADMAKSNTQAHDSKR